MKFTLFSLLFFSLLISSCAPIYYIPNMNNVPILREKGEASVSAGISLSSADSTSQFSLQTAYLIHPNFGIQTNSVLYDVIPYQKRPSPPNRNGSKGQIHEIGLGYVVNTEYCRSCLSIWGITGMGKMTTFRREDGQLSTNLFIFGINPTASFMRDYFSLSYSMKSFYLGYSNIKGNLMYQGEREVDYLLKHRNNFIIEPTMTTTIGTKKIRFISQGTISVNVNNGNDRQKDWILSFGLSYNFFTKKKYTPIDF